MFRRVAINIRTYEIMPPCLDAVPVAPAGLYALLNKWFSVRVTGFMYLRGYAAKRA